jgi:hypothetical protein
MKRLFLILIPLMILSGCKDDTVPITAKFPEVPADLKNACPDLAKVDPKTDKISEVLEVVTANYSQYYECKIKVDDWIEWYNSQKAIFDKVN